MARVKLRELNPSGSLDITGSLSVTGQTTIIQTDTQDVGLIISGAAAIVKAEMQSQIVSASLSIQNLGALSDPSNEDFIDLGEFF